MGKRRKGSNRMDGAGLRGLADAVGDEEGVVLVVCGVSVEVDMWEKEQDEEIMESVKIRGRGRKEEKGNKEVMALSGTDSDSDLDLPTIKKLRKKQKDKERAEKEAVEEDGDISDSDMGSAEEEDDVRRWGSKKKYYYGGNTGEEIEEELGDSELEEDKIEEQEAAKLQSRQLEMMEEEDFLDAFVVKKAEKSEKKVEAKESLIRDLSKLSRKEQVQLFKQQSPEFDGVVADFTLRMGEAVKLARVVALAEGGSLPGGPVLDYVRNKLELVLNYCTNILAYLMFKSRGVSLALHPVTGRLVQYRQLIDRLEEMDKIVMPQVEEVLRRAGKGEEVKQMVKEERRKFKRELDRKNQKPLKFGRQEVEKNEIVSKKKRKNKRKAESNEVSGLEGLTGDEKMAVELYQVIKKSKNNEDLEDEELEGDMGLDTREDEPENDVDDEVNTYNDKNEIEQEDEEEKRAITYKIAKNKGLMPKRSKLQRNPRVKNRMKFEKAKKRRKGAVREVRDQNQKYSGEASGMNVRVKKGVQIH
eukprot:GFUD01020267.1.p2 GENE.GFUD01020267.1~~GFUD01020267.1.p2  ORF type:complete len:529 (-),score=248.69 GFUD01020267.1:123-1709(-)